MSNNKILVVGEICDDIFIYGSASRLCPDVPAPVFRANKEVKNQGMAGNTIRNLEALGHKVDSITQIAPITKTRYVDEKLNYTFLRVDKGESSIDSLDEYGVRLVTEEEISKFDAVVISDYGKGFLSESNIEKFCKNNANTFLDTKKILGDYCREAKIIKINTPEFEQQKGKINLNDWVNKLIVTLGEQGCMFNKEKGFTYYPVDKVDVFDLSGAGDSFLAALVAKYLETNNIDDAIKYANKKSAEVVQKKGVSVISK
jgi:D-beta-D-heptose 7-phosphate kinase/D-beta-D-heptose 1-phosphate adenosyltransferase